MPQNVIVTVFAAVIMCSVVSSTVALGYMIWEQRASSICKATLDKGAAKR